MPKSTKQPTPDLEFESNFDRLPSEVTESIFFLLPIRTLIQTSTVSKKWLSIISSPSFVNRVYTLKKPWLFLHCQISPRYSPTNQAFAFDPESNEWQIIPTSLLPPGLHHDGECSTVQDGFFISTSPTFTVRPILKKPGYADAIAQPIFSRMFPEIGVLVDQMKLDKIVVVGGRLNNSDKTMLFQVKCVEVYDASSNCWEICPPLPDGFWREGRLSFYLSSTVAGNRFYVFDNEACLLSGFEIESRSWGEVYAIEKPAEVMHIILMACDVKYLVFVGLCEGPEIVLWSFDVEKKELLKFAAMPRELMGIDLMCVRLTQDFRDLRIVGSRNMIYFVLVGGRFGKLPYPSCVCEIDSDCGTCSWRRLPDVPVVNDMVNSGVVYGSPVLLDFGG